MIRNGSRSSFVFNLNWSLESEQLVCHSIADVAACGERERMERRRNLCHTTQRSDSFPSENDSSKVAKQELKKNRN
ncbi:hypothetical protein [Prevotella corporis]|uniref:hypothetical protein n=1 Tax=Prevotella corporis TaxID=28128 RepID=UPI0023F1DB2D|nr:hypothetical protein [Prevotella corporis]